MTEADTFNALKRSPFDVVWDEWCSVPNDDNIERDVIKRHGWVFKEFWKEHSERSDDSR
jgi:hypothetical protein